MNKNIGFREAYFVHPEGNKQTGTYASVEAFLFSANNNGTATRYTPVLGSKDGKVGDREINGALAFDHPYSLSSEQFFEKMEDRTGAIFALKELSVKHLLDGNDSPLEYIYGVHDSRSAIRIPVFADGIRIDKANPFPEEGSAISAYGLTWTIWFSAQTAIEKLDGWLRDEHAAYLNALLLWRKSHGDYIGRIRTCRGKRRLSLADIDDFNVWSDSLDYDKRVVLERVLEADMELAKTLYNGD